MYAESQPEQLDEAAAERVAKAVEAHIKEKYGHVQLVHGHINLTSKEGPKQLFDRIYADVVGVILQMAAQRKRP